MCAKFNVNITAQRKVMSKNYQKTEWVHEDFYGKLCNFINDSINVKGTHHRLFFSSRQINAKWLNEEIKTSINIDAIRSVRTFPFITNSLVTELFCKKNQIVCYIFAPNEVSNQESTFSIRNVLAPSMFFQFEPVFLCVIIYIAMNK